MTDPDKKTPDSASNVLKDILEYKAAFVGTPMADPLIAFKFVERLARVVDTQVRDLSNELSQALQRISALEPVGAPVLEECDSVLEEEKPPILLQALVPEKMQESEERAG